MPYVILCYNCFIIYLSSRIKIQSFRLGYSDTADKNLDEISNVKNDLEKKSTITHACIHPFECSQLI